MLQGWSGSLCCSACFTSRRHVETREVPEYRAEAVGICSGLLFFIFTDESSLDSLLPPNCF